MEDGTFRYISTDFFFLLLIRVLKGWGDSSHLALSSEELLTAKQHITTKPNAVGRLRGSSLSGNSMTSSVFYAFPAGKFTKRISQKILNILNFPSRRSRFYFLPDFAFSRLPNFVSLEACLSRIAICYLCQWCKLYVSPSV